jgi:hypothetical protein
MALLLYRSKCRKIKKPIEASLCTMTVPLGKE